MIKKVLIGLLLLSGIPIGIGLVLVIIGISLSI